MAAEQPIDLNKLRAVTEPLRDRGGLTYELHVVPIGAQGKGQISCNPGTRLHSVNVLPRGAIAGTPLQALVVLEVERRD
jgi:hypothetical protein